MGNFYTDTISKDPRFKTTKVIADVGLLEPVTREKVQAILADAQAHGMDLMIFETFRSQARQAQLFKAGATRLKTVGVHNYGLACDIVRRVGGKPSWKGDFSFLGELARIHGLIWGGDWGAPDRPHTFVDAVHVQRCSIKDQGPLFRGEWYPDADYDPYKESAAPQGSPAS
jgi:hypothetical protein